MTEKKLPSTSHLLEGLSKRVEKDVRFMASIIASYRTHERLSDSDLVSHLAASHEQIARLSLCKRPDAHSPDFPQKVKELSSYSGIEPERIVNIIREVEGLQALSQASWTQEQKEERSDLQEYKLRSGVLAAARDRLEMDKNDKVGSDNEERSNSEEEGDSEYRELNND